MSHELLTAQLLRLASDSFSNHGCNDFHLEDTPDNRALVKRMNANSGLAGEDAEPHVSDGKIIVADFALMDFFAHELEGSKQ